MVKPEHSYFGMQVDSSALNIYWTIFRSILCDHFQVRRNIQENFIVEVIFDTTKTVLYLAELSFTFAVNFFKVEIYFQDSFLSYQ